MANPSLVQHIEGYSTGATTISATLGATPGKGNVLIMVIGSSGNVAPTTPVGWFRIIARATAPGICYIFKKRMPTAAEATTYTATVSNTVNYTMVIQEWTACDPYNPHIQSNSSAQTGSATWSAINIVPAYLNMQIVEYVCPTTTVVPNTPAGYTAMTATASPNAGQIYPFLRTALSADTTTTLGTAVTFPSSVGGDYAALCLAPEPAKPYIIQSNNVAFNNQTNFANGGLSETTAVDSLLINSIATSNTSGTFTPAAGWTLVDDTTGGTGRLITIRALNKAFTSQTCGTMSATSSGIIDLEEYTGTDQTTGVNGHTVATGTLTASASGTLNTATFTPTVVGTLPIIRVSTDDTTRSISTPTNFALLNSRIATEDYTDFVSNVLTTDTTTAQVYTINTPTAAGSGTLIVSAIFLAPNSVTTTGVSSYVMTAVLSKVGSTTGVQNYIETTVASKLATLTAPKLFVETTVPSEKATTTAPRLYVENTIATKVASITAPRTYVETMGASARAVVTGAKTYIEAIVGSRTAQVTGIHSFLESTLAKNVATITGARTYLETTIGGFFGTKAIIRIQTVIASFTGSIVGKTTASHTATPTLTPTNRAVVTAKQAGTVTTTGLVGRIVTRISQAITTSVGSSRASITAARTATPTFLGSKQSTITGIRSLAPVFLASNIKRITQVVRGIVTSILSYFGNNTPAIVAPPSALFMTKAILGRNFATKGEVNNKFLITAQINNKFITKAELQ